MQFWCSHFNTATHELEIQQKAEKINWEINICAYTIHILSETLVKVYKVYMRVTELLLASHVHKQKILRSNLLAQSRSESSPLVAPPKLMNEAPKERNKQEELKWQKCVSTEWTQDTEWQNHNIMKIPEKTGNKECLKTESWKNWREEVVMDVKQNDGTILILLIQNKVNQKQDPIAKILKTENEVLQIWMKTQRKYTLGKRLKSLQPRMKVFYRKYINRIKYKEENLLQKLSWWTSTEKLGRGMSIIYVETKLQLWVLTP